MNTITPIVMLFYVAGINTKQSARELTTPPEPEASHELTTTDLSDTEYDTLTRRNIEQFITINKTADAAFSRDKKHKKSRKSLQHSTETTEKTKTTKRTSKHETKKSTKSSKTRKAVKNDSKKTNKDTTEYEKLSLRHKNSLEQDMDSSQSKILRSRCVSETDKHLEKCKRACNRSHEDVCDRLKCSERSKRALKKECTGNCNKIFNTSSCYRRNIAEIE